MKTIVISDLHGYLPDPKTFNEAEVMFICGDIVPLEIQRDIDKSMQWIYKDFLSWSNALPVDKVFIIGGNHDFVLENFGKDVPKEDGSGVYKIHQVDIGSNGKLTYIIDPIVYKSKDGNEYTIKSMPYIENCTGWAFSTDCREIKEKCKEVFDDHFDILLTHDAPDLKPFRNDWGGDMIKESIVEAMKENNYPNYWFFGHIHDNPHTLSDIKYKTEMYNASIRNDNYEIVYNPLYIDIQKKPIAEDNGLVVSEYKDYNKNGYVCGDYITNNETGEVLIYHHTDKHNGCVYYIAVDSARVVKSYLTGISTYGNMNEYRHSTREEIIRMNKDIFFQNDLIWNENFIWRYK